MEARPVESIKPPRKMTTFSLFLEIEHALLQEDHE
jgi:hypothetical protein